jgi:hypothetical protein
MSTLNNNVVCSTAQKHFQLAPPGRACKPADTVHAAEQALAARLRYRDAVQSSQHSPRDLLPQRFYWRVWMAHVRFVQLQRQAKRLCRRDKRARRSELVEQLASAARRSDLALQWKLAYQLAGGSHGPKKRRYNMPQRFRPTASEWVEELVQSGPAGGCSARTLDAFSTSEVVSGMDVGTATLGSFADYNGSPMSIPPVQVEVHAETLANEDFAGLCASVRSLRRGRSVPEWSAPAEVWRLLLFPAEHLSQGHTLPPGTHGSCEGLLRTLLYLVRHNQEVPWLWNLSSPVELDKSNGKRGCAGKRLIHKLDPIGKSFFHMLWTRQGDVARHYACGFLRHRRREQAILQQRCLNWKLQKTGQSRVSVFYDVKNAFPSPSHSSLDLAVCSNCRPADANLLCLRHRAAFILVRDPFKPEFTVVQIGCGNLQGDRVAPSQFLAVYHPALDEWNDRCRRMEHGGQFVLRDPVSGLQVDTALSTFADDVARTHVVPRIADFHQPCKPWTRILMRAWVGFTWAKTMTKKSFWSALWAKGPSWQCCAFTTDTYKFVAAAKECANTWAVSFTILEPHPLKSPIALLWPSEIGQSCASFGSRAGLLHLNGGWSSWLWWCLLCTQVLKPCRLMMVTMSGLEECLLLWLENFAKVVPASSHTKMLTATIAACQIRLCLNFCKSFRLPGSAEPAVFSGGKASPGTLATMCRYWPQFLDNMAGKMGRLLGWMGESLLLQTHGCGNWWKIWTSWVSQIWWLTSHCRFFSSLQRFVCQSSYQDPAGA